MSTEDAVSEEPGVARLVAGRYRLLAPLGEGGMGTVWRAKDDVLGREVAVKEVRAPVGLSTAEIGRLYTRLEREAWAAARVVHPNVVTVHDVAREDGRPWIVMELVRGQSLADLLAAAGALTPERTAAIGAEVLAALRAADEAGVLHRDVKPANVLMAKDGRVVLTDFGIAVIEGNSTLTVTGQVVGSPEFLAPERALGQQPGFASDLWSLGVLLHVAVEGSSPFRRNTLLNTLRAVADAELPPLRRAGALAPVIQGLLRKNPEERPGAEQLLADLRRIAAGEPAAGGSPAATHAAAPAAAPPTAPATAPAAPPTAPAVPVAPVPPMAAHSVAQPVVPHPVPEQSAGHATVPPGFGPAPAGVPPKRPRTALVVAVAVLAVVALAGIGYTLMNNNKDDGRKSTAGPSAAAAGHGDAGTSAQDGRTSAPPSPKVRVTVTGTHTDYSGQCPPPDAEAPTFTATFTVSRPPAEISYRFVSEDGSVIDRDWRTLSFPEGDTRSKKETVRLDTYNQKGKIETAIGVEIQSPIHDNSNVVPLSLSCD